MSETPNLALPYILAAQAQKHVTHNEAIRALDAVVQLSVADRDLSDPPASPTDGARYLVAESPTGAWSGHAGEIAAAQDGGWTFLAPREGWLAWIADEDLLLAYDGAAWSEVSAAVNPAPLVGVNATADTTNRLAVKSPASLFDNVGAGHQAKLNKAAAGDTGSLLFQTGYSGRAEFGLLGSDDFSVKVTEDGSDWIEAIRVDRRSGGVSMRFFDSLQLVIGYEAVAVVEPPSTGGLLFLSLVSEPTSNPQLPATAIVAYDVAASSPTIIAFALGDRAHNLDTTIPDGTTGPDGEVSIAADASGNLYIENRYVGSSARQFCLTFINSFRDLSS